MKQLCIGFICGVAVCCGMWVLTQHGTVAEATEYDRRGEVQGGPALAGESCLGDLNNDGVVNVSDLLILLGNWGTCPGPCFESDNNCCKVSDTPGCEDTACCKAVCIADPYCCDVQWDAFCVSQAADAFNEVCGCVPFCGDGVCDPDETCANCPEDCGPCPSPCEGAEGNCCDAHDTPGCNNPACCEAVCNVDPYCCNVEWDGSCATTAEIYFNPICVCVSFPQLCANADGSCCTINSTLGCEVPACCEAVCNADPYCCQVEWDFNCAHQAVNDFPGECGCATK